MRPRDVGWIAAVLLVAGVAGSEAVGQSRADQGGDALPTSEQQGGDATPPSEASDGEMLADERRQAIDWEAASSYRRLAAEDVAQSDREALAESPVPVLLPDDTEVLESLEPTVGETWYAVMLEVEGREVTIEGDRVARVVADMELPPAGKRQADREFHVTQTHAVMTVTFTAFGAGYTIDVECEEVDERGRCTNESFAVDLANRLAVLPGSVATPSEQTDRGGDR